MLDVLTRIDLLIIDELGYLSLTSQTARIFFWLISKRYERGSIIVTSNKPFEQWGGDLQRRGGGSDNPRPATAPLVSVPHPWEELPFKKYQQIGTLGWGVLRGNLGSFETESIPPGGLI
jgi:hypothetical protein